MEPDVKSTGNSASVCKSSPLRKFSSILNCFDRNIAMEVFSESLQLRKMTSHSHQNHAQFKEDVQSAFMEGKFTVQKTNRKFSKIRLDHNHEQLNGKISGVGGAIGITESDSSLQRWLVAGPETAHFIDEFEYYVGLYQLENVVQEHHDLNEASQVKFFSDVL